MPRTKTYEKILFYVKYIYKYIQIYLYLTYRYTYFFTIYFKYNIYGFIIIKKKIHFGHLVIFELVLYCYIKYDRQ